MSGLSTYEKFQLAVVIIMAAVWGLTWAGRRRPDIPWLQAFRTAFPPLPEKERARLRRRANLYSGLELILAGIIVPMGYVALTVMMFNSFTPGGIAITVGISVLCIGLGITAIVRR